MLLGQNPQGYGRNMFDSPIGARDLTGSRPSARDLSLSLPSLPCGNIS